MFKPDTLIILDSKKGITKEYNVAQRGRELLQRYAPSNYDNKSRAFYVTIGMELVPLKWVRGNLGDVFLDNPLLPESARISIRLRETIQVL